MAKKHKRYFSGRSVSPFLLLLIPVAVFVAVVFAYPMADMIVRSLHVEGHLTLGNYERILNRPIYADLLLVTIEISFTVVLMSVVIGYPLAYAMAFAKPRVAAVMLLVVLVPFFTSVLVRTYSFMVILSPVGLVNSLLEALGLAPVSLLYNRAGVIIAMTYVLVPYMVLTLYSVMKGIDPSLVPAANSLGASPWQAFRRIFLPLTFPGVAAGSLLVLLLSMGYFITPRLVGGPRDQMIAVAIAAQVEQTANWGFASALSAVLLVVVVFGFAVYARLFGLNSLLERKLE